MAATKANQKFIEKEVEHLIECVTDFSQEDEEDLENFELCRRYVLSNIYYHRFLDTSSHDVRRQLQGIATKLRVHALPQRATRLEALWKEFASRQEWSQHVQWDIEWRLLSLLVNLSNQPTSLYTGGPAPLTAVLASAGLPATSEQPSDEEIDWEEELKVSMPEYSPYQSPEEWSSSDEDEAGASVGRPASGVLVTQLLGLASLAAVPVDRSSARNGATEDEDAHSWLECHVAPCYQPQPPRPALLRPQPDAAETFHHYQHLLGLSVGAEPVKVPEWSACREVVWQLLSPADSPLFHRKHDSFVPGAGYRVQGLTESAFSAVLRRFCRPISALQRLRDFSRDPSSPSSGGGGERIPATHQAFATALVAYLQRLDVQLADLERQLIQQVHTLTLLGLECRLSDWIVQVLELDKIHHQGVTWASHDRPAWLRSARLVSVLYDAVQTCSDVSWSASLLEMFLATLQPLLAVAGAWMVSEVDPDPHREFPIERNEEIGVTDVRYWSGGVTVNSSFVDWWTDGVEPLPFLTPHMDSIAQTAKCLRMLGHLNLIKHIDEFSLQDEFNQATADFLATELRSNGAEDRAGLLIPADGEAVTNPPTAEGGDQAAHAAAGDGDAPLSEDSGRGSAAGPRPPSLLRRVLGAERKPFLTAAFAGVVQALERPERPPEPPSVPVPPVRLTTSVPRLMERALSAPIIRRLRSVSGRTLAALRRDFRLLEHLRMLRRVYLMESGDLMAEFCRPLYATLRSPCKTDESVTLTLALENCVSGRYPEMAARFSVSAAGCSHSASAAPLERLTEVELKYHAPWPATLVITEHSLKMYQEMFTFILQLKYTLWSLQALSFKDLGAELGRPSLDLSVTSALAPADGDSATLAPLTTIALRLQLLRAWLLHFVGNIHSYIMMRVLHSTSLELESRLESAADIDSIVNAHSTYISVLHRRCLLSGAPEQHLHAAVVNALKVALQLSELWPRGGASVAETALVSLETEYVRSHRLVAGLLKQYRNTMSHVDSLASVMSHNSPCQVQSAEIS